jgi:hypothetical protein
MKGLIGLVFFVGGGLIGWWALNKAIAGNDFYNWIWVPALILCAFGIGLSIARIRKWMSD